MPSPKSAHLFANLVIAASGRTVGAQIVDQLVEELVEGHRAGGGWRGGQPKCGDQTNIKTRRSMGFFPLPGDGSPSKGSQSMAIR